MLDNERWDDVAERVVADDFIPVRTVIFLPRWRACRSPAARPDYARRVAGASGAAGQRKASPIWPNCPKTRSARLTSAPMPTSCANARGARNDFGGQRDRRSRLRPAGRTSRSARPCRTRVFKIAESRANKDEGPKNIASPMSSMPLSPVSNSCSSSPHDGHRVNTGYDDLKKRPPACSRRI